MRLGFSTSEQSEFRMNQSRTRRELSDPPPSLSSGRKTISARMGSKIMRISARFYRNSLSSRYSMFRRLSDSISSFEATPVLDLSYQILDKSMIAFYALRLRPICFITTRLQLHLHQQFKVLWIELPTVLPVGTSGPKPQMI
jgi:hypothetical protein